MVTGPNQVGQKDLHSISLFNKHVKTLQERLE